MVFSHSRSGPVCLPCSMFLLAVFALCLSYRSGFKRQSPESCLCLFRCERGLNPAADTTALLQCAVLFLRTAFRPCACIRRACGSGLRCVLTRPRHSARVGVWLATLQRPLPALRLLWVGKASLTIACTTSKPRRGRRRAEK
jgi:hypothetical protein